MRWVDGTLYDGEWQFGAQHGKGTLTLPTGEVRAGRFENNVYVGPLSEEEPVLSAEQAEDINVEDPTEGMEF